MNKRKTKKQNKKIIKKICDNLYKQVLPIYEDFFLYGTGVGKISEVGLERVIPYSKEWLDAKLK